MAATLTLKMTHPAMYTTLSTPPATPVSPTKSYPVQPIAIPITSYALLRSHHAHAIRYVIAKLRWEQANNDYLRNEDAWLNHNRMIQKLEQELKNVEQAQKGLDKFPNCFAPVAFPKAHGPATKHEHDEEIRLKAEKDAELDAKLDKQFPWLKQLFIGPMTKQQARNMKMVRQQLKEGDFEDLSVLLPSENLRMAMGQGKKEPAPPPGMVKKPYNQIRYEREKAKIAAELAARDAAAGKPAVAAPAGAEEKKTPIGPQTKEEWMAGLPVFGPITKAEHLLLVQREQRHAILTFLRKPWPEYDAEAAELMAQMGRFAIKRLNQDVAAGAGAGGAGKVSEKEAMKRAEEKKRPEKTAGKTVGEKGRLVEVPEAKAVKA